MAKWYLFFCKLCATRVSFLCVLFFSQNAFSNYKINGMSLYSNYGDDLFIAALLSEETDDLKPNPFNENDKRRIEIRVVSEKILRRQFSRIWVNGSAVNSNASDFELNAENIIEFTRCIKGRLKKGDVILIDYDKEVGTSLYVNSVYIHTFAEPSFFNLLLSVLIGDVPLSTKMKEELLSDFSKIKSSDLAKTFNSLSPSNERIAYVKKWAMPKEQSFSENASSITSAEEKITQPLDAVIPSNNIEIAPVVAATNSTSSLKDEKPKEQELEPTTGAFSQEGVSQNKGAIPKNTDHESISSLQKIPSTTVEKTATPAPADNVEEDDLPFTMESLIAERKFSAKVTEWLETKSSFPVLVADRLADDGIRMTITIDRNGKLIGYREHEKAKHAALAKGAIKLIKKAAPYPEFPDEIVDSQLDLDLFFHLHWRFKT